MTDTPAPRRKARPFSTRAMPGFGVIAGAAFVILYAPITILVIFSFNETAAMTEWGGFSFRWYAEAWENERVQEATVRSLVVAVAASFLATLLATLAALGTTRTRPWRGQTAVFAMINQPLMVPEIVTGVALLVFFAMIKEATGITGLGYLIVAHTAFCIPFAYLPIRARLQSMDMTLERAAADLYAPPAQVFRRVTLPLMAPGILAGAMLSFVISLDDVVITEFVKSAGEDTLPTYMLGQIRRGITPEMNAIATVLLAISAFVVTIFFILNRKKS